MDQASISSTAAAAGSTHSLPSSSAIPVIAMKTDLALLLEKLTEIEQRLLAKVESGECDEVPNLIKSQIATVQNIVFVQLQYTQQRLAEDNLRRQWLRASAAALPTLVYPTAAEYYHGSEALPPPGFGWSMAQPMAVGTSTGSIKSSVSATTSEGSSEKSFEMSATDAFHFRLRNPRKGSPPRSYVCHRCGHGDHFVENCGNILNLHKKRAPPPSSYVCHKCNVSGLGHRMHNCF